MPDETQPTPAELAAQAKSLLDPIRDLNLDVVSRALVIAVDALAASLTPPPAPPAP
jgi:hypothetical protein